MDRAAWKLSLRLAFWSLLQLESELQSVAQETSRWHEHCMVIVRKFYFDDKLINWVRSAATCHTKLFGGCEFEAGSHIWSYHSHAKQFSGSYGPLHTKSPYRRARTLFEVVRCDYSNSICILNLVQQN